MKKLTALLLALAMLLAMAGCSRTRDDGETGKEPEIPSAAAPQQPQEPAGSSEPAGVEPAIPVSEEPGGADADASAGQPDDRYVIRVSHTDVTLFYAGETFRFTVWDSNGNDPDACTYTSADPAVAAVDETGGEITAVAPGTTKITAHTEFGGEKQDIDCIVRCRWEEEAVAGEESITASHTDITLSHAGETFTLSAQGVSGIYASSFVSADPGVAVVDWITGVVTAVAPGTTTVTMHVECEAGQYDFPCTVRCQWPEEGGTTSGTAAAPSLSEFFATLQDRYEGLGMMMAMEGDLLENYYPGLSGIAAVEEILIREPMISVSNVAVGLVKLSGSASSEDIAAVKSILQARITAQAEGGAWYPESCATWEKGVITSASNVVAMFVHPSDAQAMANLFTSSFGS